MRTLKTVLKIIFLAIIFLTGFAGVGYLGMTYLPGRVPAPPQESVDKPGDEQEQNAAGQKSADGQVQKVTAPKNEIKLDVTRIMNRTPSEVESVVGKTDGGYVPYPPNGRWNGVDGSSYPAQKASYARGYLEAVYINGKLARLTINKEQSASSGIQTLQSIGITTDKKPFLTYENVNMWLDINGLFKVMVYSDFIQIVTDIKYD